VIIDLTWVYTIAPMLDDVYWPWYHAQWSFFMATKRKKAPKLSRRQRRRIRIQQIIFAFIAIIVIASFLVSLIT
jgi:hypothetical protein